MEISYKTKKLFNVEKCQKNSKFLVWKYIKVLGFLKTIKTFLRKGTKHKKYYMEGLNSKNKNVKGGGFP